MRLSIRSAASVLALAAATVLPAVPAFAQDEAAAEDMGGIRDIVVTARRVEERLQDVPLSITAFDTQSLADNQIAQVQDLGAQVPNVITGKTSIPGGGQIAIRGIQGQSLPRIGLDTRVGVYLDGVYLARSQGQSFGLPDLERVEVLKGPQGTLFGRNVTAGSINLITAAPTGEFGGILEGGLGSRDRKRLRATLNLPEMGGFSVRVTYLHDAQDGDIKNTAAGNQFGPIVFNVPAVAANGATPASRAVSRTFQPLAAANSFGYNNSDNLFVAVRYDGIDGLIADYKFDYNDQREANATQNIVGYGAGSCVAAAIAFGGNVNECRAAASVANPNPTQILFNGGVISRPGTISQIGGVGGYLRSTGAQDFSAGFRRPDSKAEPFTAPALVRSWGQNLTLNYEASDSLNLRSITAYRELKTFVQQNGDGGSFSLRNDFLTSINPTLYPAASFPAAGNTLFTFGSTFQGQKQNQFSQELQAFGSINDSIDYLVGAFYFKEKGTAYQIGANGTVGNIDNLLAALSALPGNFTSTTPAVPGLPVWAANGGVNQWGVGAGLSGDFSRSTSESKAIFGRLTFKPVEGVDIVIGGRYTWDKKTNQLEQYMANLLDADPNTAGRQQVPAFFKRKWDKFTYDATITYHVTSDINVYGRYATAYLAGGQIRNVGFNPETTKAAEIGVKADLFNRRVRFNAAGFWQKSKNSQYNRTGGVAVVLPGDLTNTPVNVTATNLFNLGAARVKGFEAELTVMPVAGLTLSGSAGYVNQKYVTLPPLAPINDPQTPEWTLQGAVQYDTPPLLGDAYLSLRFDANYRSKYQPQPVFTGTVPTALLTQLGLTQAQYNAAFLEGSKVGGFWVANARVSLVDIPMWGTKGRLSGYVRNMFDADKLTYIAFYGISAGASFQEKRNYGLDLTLTF